MASQKIAKLIIALADMTARNRPLWVKSAESGTFVASFPNQSVTISPYHNDVYDYGTYKVTIINSMGELVEDVEPCDVNEHFIDANKTFRELYEGARMQAMGVDAAVDEILSYLDKPGRNY